MTYGLTPRQKEARGVFDVWQFVEAARDDMEQRQKVMDFVRLGWTAREIASVTGLSRAEIYDFISDGPIYAGPDTQNSNRGGGEVSLGGDPARHALNSCSQQGSIPVPTLEGYRQ